MWLYGDSYMCVKLSLIETQHNLLERLKTQQPLLLIYYQQPVVIHNHVKVKHRVKLQSLSFAGALLNCRMPAVVEVHELNRLELNSALCLRGTGNNSYSIKQ